MGAIDIGASAVNRGYGSDPGYTVIALDNPANNSGVITTIEIWALENMEGCKVGTFYGTPPNFTLRDYATIGNVVEGSKQTFGGLNIAVQAGDYIGIYHSAGTIEWDMSGYAGVYWKSDDQFDAGQQVYALDVGDAISLYGTGATVAVGRSFGFIFG